MNKDASTYQKMNKILQLINTTDMIYQINYDRDIVLPQIDRVYALDKDSNINNIFLVDTNFNPVINFPFHIGDRLFINHNLYKHVNKEFTQLNKYDHDNINQFNILPEILELMNNDSGWIKWLKTKRISHYNPGVFFYRSFLINCLLALGYQTINIIDLSCRIINPSNPSIDIIIGDYYNKNNKYVCESIKQPNYHFEREINSIKF